MRVVIGTTVLEIDLWLLILIGIFIVAFIILAINRGIVAHRFKISAGSEDLIGKTAEVKIALAPKGFVFLEGERWSAIAEDDRVKPGEEVTVTRVDGLTLYVTKKK